MMWQHNHGFGVESKHGRMYRVVVHVAFGGNRGWSDCGGLWIFRDVAVERSPAPSDCGPIDLVLASCGPAPLARILVGGLKGHGDCHGHGYRHGKRSWREYDQWWNEVGRQSFEIFAGTPKQPREK